MTSNQELNEQIEHLRKQMTQVAQLVGLSSPITIQLSQELDKLLLLSLELELKSKK